jgi:hypothetical protein
MDVELLTSEQLALLERHYAEYGPSVSSLYFLRRKVSPPSFYVVDEFSHISQKNVLESVSDDVITKWLNSRLSQSEGSEIDTQEAATPLFALLSDTTQLGQKFQDFPITETQRVLLEKHYNEYGNNPLSQRFFPREEIKVVLNYLLIFLSIFLS